MAKHAVTDHIAFRTATRKARELGMLAQYMNDEQRVQFNEWQLDASYYEDCAYGADYAAYKVS